MRKRRNINTKTKRDKTENQIIQQKIARKRDTWKKQKNLSREERI